MQVNFEGEGHIESKVVSITSIQQSQSLLKYLGVGGESFDKSKKSIKSRPLSQGSSLTWKHKPDQVFGSGLCVKAMC